METSEKVSWSSGIGSWVLAAALQIGGYQSPPIAVFLAIVGIVFFAYAIFAAKKLPSIRIFTRSSISNPTNFTARDVFFYVNPHTVTDGDYREIQTLLLKLLADGKVEAKGRLMDSGSNPRLNNIDAKFWETGKFSFYFLSEDQTQLAEVYGLPGTKTDYRDLQFNGKQVLAEIQPYRPLDANDRSLSRSLGLICALLAIGALLNLPYQKVVNQFSKLRNTSIDEGALLIGPVDVQMWPALPDGHLAVRIPLTNNLDTALFLNMHVATFEISNIPIVGAADIKSAYLSGHEKQFYTLPFVPQSTIEAQGGSFTIGLDYFAEYGPTKGQMQWKVHRAMQCTVPAANFNLGTCNFLKLENESIPED